MYTHSKYLFLMSFTIKHITFGSILDKGIISNNFIEAGYRLSIDISTVTMLFDVILESSLAFEDNLGKIGRDEQFVDALQ